MIIFIGKDVHQNKITSTMKIKGIDVKQEPETSII